MAVCNPACAEDQIITYCEPCDLQSALRKAGIEKISLIDCDATIDDLTDEAEWEALKAANKIVPLPLGRGTLNRPTVEKQEVSPCTPELPVSEETVIEFVTRLFDNTTYKDFDLENDVKNKILSKTLVYSDCNGILYYQRNWVTGTNPGHPNVSAEVWRAEDGKIQTLNFEFTINTFKNGFKGLPMTAAIKEAIFGCVEAES